MSYFYRCLSISRVLWPFFISLTFVLIFFFLLPSIQASEQIVGSRYFGQLCAVTSAPIPCSCLKRGSPCWKVDSNLWRVRSQRLHYTSAILLTRFEVIGSKERFLRIRKQIVICSDLIKKLCTLGCLEVLEWMVWCFYVFFLLPSFSMLQTILLVRFLCLF